MSRIAGVLLVACLLAGCGTSKSASTTTTTTTTSAKGAAARAYEQKMAAIAPVLQSKIFKLRLALEQVKSPIVGRKQLGNLEARVNRGIAQLKAVQPPADVAVEHAKLIAAYRSLRTEFDHALKPLLRQHTSDAARIEAGRLAHAPAFRVIGDTLHAIIAKGYDLGFPPGS